MAVFKYFKRSGVLVVSYVEDGATLPAGLVSKMDREYAKKVNNPLRTPVIFVVTNDMKAAIKTIGKDALVKEARKEARELSKGIKDGTIKVTSGEAVDKDKGDTKDGSAAKEAKDEDKNLLIPSQEWTNAKGGKITAGVVKIDGDKVVFRMPNGKDVPYAISKLSQDSQEKLKALTAPAQP